MSLSRRAFLRATAASGLTLPLALRGQVEPTPPSGIFQHGVASGDPLTDRVILWTRLTPRDNGTTQSIDVRWRIADDDGLTRNVMTGVAATSGARDFTVKVDVAGLRPGRPYYYGFEAASERSPVGRTRTLPMGSVNRLAFAVVSCANYPAGYFNVYRCVANREDLDAVIHVGDYIYEFENGRYGQGNSMNRIPDPPWEAVTLIDYRRRYAGYRTDPDLQEAHRRHPFIAVWDDHEIVNDAWRGGGVNHNPEKGEGDWETRRGSAFQAYLEWMPVRNPQNRAIRLYRSFRFGTLADLTMLDTRALRDKQVATTDIAGLADRTRTMMGATQEAWLIERLRDSQRAGTDWRLIGQQVVFARMAYPGKPVLNSDSWDGYQAARDRVLDTFNQLKVQDVAILTGDAHSSWGFDVPRDPWNGYQAQTGQGSLAVELVTPAVSSPPLFADETMRQRAAFASVVWPHLKYLDGEHRGYLLLDVTPRRLRADWYHVPTVLERSAQEAAAMSLVCERGSSRLVTA